MKKRKETVPIGESPIVIEPPYSEEEIAARHTEYRDAPFIKFDENRREKAFEPICLKEDATIVEIQYNFCTDTFCHNYGMPFTIYKHRGLRSVKNYNFTGDKSKGQVVCNIMEHVGASKKVNGNTYTLLSNWSLAEEIKRLKTLSMVRPEQPTYEFHEKGCPVTTTPFNDEDKNFQRFGKSSSGSTRYRCKSCLKTTSVKPGIDQSFSHGQKRNDVLVSLTKDVLAKTPVRQTCEKLSISPDTYYRKLELLHQKCLEFLDRHESKLKNKEFDDLYLVSDAMLYYLNNIRKKGYGGKTQTPSEKANASEASTYINVTADIDSKYVFRADLCYDPYVSLEDIESDTLKYHCDHTYPYLQKNGRILNFPFMPQPPTAKDAESTWEYEKSLSIFESRKKFVDGLHTRRLYTTLAQLHLLKENLNYKRLIFVSDDDYGIKNAAFRVFRGEFMTGNAVYFTSQYDKSLTRKEAYTRHIKAVGELRRLAGVYGIPNNRLYEAAKVKIFHDLNTHPFYETEVVEGIAMPISSHNYYLHPYPAKDEGSRFINLVSFSPHLEREDLAEMIANINTRATDNFFQVLRRKVSVLERPLTAARGDGKTYIYVNYNPKYAHMLLTIFRTFYNFVWEAKGYNRNKVTPAQRIGIADRKYEVKDIVYFR